MKIHSVVNSVRFRRQAFVLEILLRANGFQLLRLLVIDKQFIYGNNRDILILGAWRYRKPVGGGVGGNEVIGDVDLGQGLIRCLPLKVETLLLRTSGDVLQRYH